MVEKVNAYKDVSALTQNLWQWNQPQILLLAVVVLICFVFSLYVFIKLKMTFKVDQASKGILFLMEGYLSYICDTYDETNEGKLPSMRFYIFSLTTFILLGNLLGLIGIEPIATSYSVTLTLSLITWLGIYVVGILFQKWRFFKKYLLPTELVGQFAPLISTSLRLFGNITGGGTIVLLTYYFAGWLWSLAFGGVHYAFFAVIITPFLHLYFDIFGAFIQTLVFTMLTTVYWTQEAVTTKKKSKKQKKQMVMAEAIY